MHDQEKLNLYKRMRTLMKICLIVEMKDKEREREERDRRPIEYRQ